jgi:basic amino acid/polyamine antiporter, APA family
LGLSRVLLAMGRRRDMPAPTSRINAAGTTPTVAVIIMGTFISLLVLLGDVRTTWAFSAFNVLIYYGITNLAALQIPADKRRFPKWVAYAGLIACFGLSFFVPLGIWLVGAGLLLLGLAWKLFVTRFFADPSAA